MALGLLPPGNAVPLTGVGRLSLKLGRILTIHCLTAIKQKSFHSLKWKSFRIIAVIGCGGWI